MEPGDRQTNVPLYSILLLVLRICQSCPRTTLSRFEPVALACRISDPSHVLLRITGSTEHICAGKSDLDPSHDIFFFFTYSHDMLLQAILSQTSPGLA
jgi:hypothetical protein